MGAIEDLSAVTAVRASKESVDYWPMASTILQIFGGTPMLISVPRGVTQRKASSSWDRHATVHRFCLHGHEVTLFADSILGNSVRAIGSPPGQ